MPHQCTKCGEIFPDAAKELLAGCTCGSKFFYYIRQERLDELNKINNSEIQDTLTELARADKVQIEKDIRDITGMAEEPDKPVILDLESVRVLGPGKFEIDIVNLFSKKRPVIYRLEEGKYIIDLTSTYKANKEEIDKKIRNPNLVRNDEKKKEVIQVDVIEKSDDEIKEENSEVQKELPIKEKEEISEEEENN